MRRVHAGLIVPNVMNHLTLSNAVYKQKQEKQREDKAEQLRIWAIEEKRRRDVIAESKPKYDRRTKVPINKAARRQAELVAELEVVEARSDLDEDEKWEWLEELNDALVSSSHFVDHHFIFDPRPILM